MRIRDIIIGTLVIGGWVVVVVWVAISVYYHEHQGSATQLISHLPG
jgi:hypothetical protein